MDPNGNMSKIAYDIAGVPAISAIMGKPDFSDPNLDSLEGDSITGVLPDLDQSQVEEFLSNPTKPGLAQSLLGTATSRVVYNPLRYFEAIDPTKPQPQAAEPSVVASITRERHASDLQGESETPVHISIMYSDGLDRTVQTKTWVDHGLLDENDPSS